MSDRPILFSAPMVRALLAGTKTQTRRIVKDSAWVMDDCDAGYDGQTIGVPPYIDRTRCPYGQPGDRLWVRENWQAWDRISHEYDEAEPWDKDRRGGLTFAQYYAEHGRPHKVTYEADPEYSGPWNPSIHMPRWASRITLEITGVRVERLQEISHRDAAAEGWPADDEARALAEHAPGCADDAAIEWYADLWDSINGRSSWDANPWVWVVEFKRQEHHHAD